MLVIYRATLEPEVIRNSEYNRHPASQARVRVEL
jgi:hypothetical protein